MHSWLRYPFVRFTPAFILGIYAFREVDSIFLLITIVFILLAILLFLRNSLFKLHVWVGTITLLVIVLLGGIRSNTYQQVGWESHFTQYVFTRYSGIVVSAPVVKNSTTNAVIEVSQVYADGKWTRCTGKIKIYVKGQLQYGDVLYIDKKPDEVERPLNPHEFDYRKYLANRNIYHQSFLNKEEFKKIGNDTPSRLLKMSINIRQAAESALEKHVGDSSALMVAKALLIGERSSISDELRNAYAHTGAIHILAISGLHLGIIYGFLFYVFGQYRKSWWFVLCSIVILWSFALIAGMPSSVVRAAFMFSVFAIGQLFHRTSNIYNTLFLSAFALLLVNPNVIYDVGFQLSYLAVLGIALAYKPLKHLVIIRNKLLGKVWNLTCISFSAQLLTAPLVIYYFHNVSLIFFFSNLIVIPLTTLILFSGIIFFTVSAFQIEFISEIIAKVMEWMILLMNISIAEIESFPGTFIDGLTISSMELILVYISIVAILLFYYRSKIHWLVVACIFWVFFIVSIVTNDFFRRDQKKIIVYHTPGNLVIDYFDGIGISTFYYRESSFETVNNRIHLSGSDIVNQLKVVDVSIPGKLLNLGGETILVIDEPLAISGIQQVLKINYLVISNNAISNFETFKYFETTLVLLDASNDYWYALHVKDYLTDQGIPVVNIRDGAYVNEQKN